MSFYRIFLIFCLLFLSACSGDQTKLNLQEKVTETRTEYKSAFFNIDQTKNTLEVYTLVNVTSGVFKYTLLDPGNNPIYAGTLQAGVILDETTPLVPIKGNYRLSLEMLDFTGDFHFTITHKN